MTTQPRPVDIDSTTFIPSSYDNHIVRHLSAMEGQFTDTTAFDIALEVDDRVLYEVYAVERPTVDGELICGTSIVHPGKIGAEYHMTKGHFHTVIDTAEVYYCLQGAGASWLWRRPRVTGRLNLFSPGECSTCHPAGPTAP